MITAKEYKKFKKKVIAEFKANWGTGDFGDDDYGCDGGGETCCGNCGGWSATDYKIEAFLISKLDELFNHNTGGDQMKGKI
jgi:hypothetical protein